MLITEAWPLSNSAWIDRKNEKDIELIKKTISSIRNLRSEMNISPGKEIDIIIKSSDSETAIFQNLRAYISRLAKINKIEIDSKATKPSQSASIVIDNNEIFIPLAGVIDIEVEADRLSKQVEAYKGRLKNVNNKLNNKNFVDRAPKDVVDNEKKKQKQYESTLKKIQNNLNSLLK